MANTNLNIRVDSEVKAQAQTLFANLGLDMSTAVNLFLRQAIMRQEIPFALQAHTPNAETLAAIQEVEQLKKAPNKRTYHSFEEILSELDEDDDE